VSSASWSTEGLERLRRSLAGYVEQGERPGLVSLVARGDEVHVDALGVLGFGDARPMRRDTIFRIASLTKPVVAAAALILVQEGRLALDEPIDRLLPELAERRVLRRLDGPLDDTVPARRPILVRHLLTLTMGMGAIMQRGRFPLSEALSEPSVRPSLSSSVSDASQTPSPSASGQARVGVTFTAHCARGASAVTPAVSMTSPRAPAGSVTGTATAPEALMDDAGTVAITAPPSATSTVPEIPVGSFVT